jgi:hypothetical protein
VSTKTKILIAYLGIFILFFAFRVPGLGYDISNSDAARWHRRSENFIKAIKSGQFQDTYQHYQPGVTLMWLNSVVEIAAHKYQLTYTTSPKTLENADYYPILHGLAKFELVVVLAVLLGIMAYVVYRLYSIKISLIFTFLMAIEIYLVGLDRWFHLTSLEAYTAFTAFLMLLLWHKTKKIKWLLFSGLFLGWSILSKVTSLSLVPIFSLFIFSFVFDKSALKTSLFLFVKYLGVFGIVTALVCVLFFPAMLVSPVSVLTNIKVAITNAVATPVSTSIFHTWFSGLFYGVIILFKLSPITLIAFIVGLLSSFSPEKKLPSFSPEKKYTEYLIILLALYYLVLTLPDKKIDRYVLVLIPPILLFVSAKVSVLSKKPLIMFLTVALVFMLAASKYYYPVYSAYYSPLFGGTSWAQKAGVYDNSGEYYAQAAFYLNTLGRNVVSYVPHNVETFSYFYKGKIVYKFSDKPNFAVSSVEHFQELSRLCPKVEAAFGPGLEKIVFVFRCYY